MKVFVTYDEHGDITSIGAPCEQFAHTVGVKAMPGHNVTVFDLTEVQYPHHFAQYQREFRVEMQSGKPILCKK